MTALTPEVTALIVKHIDETFNYQPGLRELRYVSGLAEEVGEFVGAYHRATGMARRAGDVDDVAAELADVVITAWSAAYALGIDLEAAIALKLEKVFARGWKDPR